MCLSRDYFLSPSGNNLETYRQDHSGTLKKDEKGKIVFLEQDGYKVKIETYNYRSIDLLAGPIIPIIPAFLVVPSRNKDYSISYVGIINETTDKNIIVKKVIQKSKKNVATYSKYANRAESESGVLNINENINVNVMPGETLYIYFPENSLAEMILQTGLNQHTVILKKKSKFAYWMITV